MEGEARRFVDVEAEAGAVVGISGGGVMEGESSAARRWAMSAAIAAALRSASA